jgi:hypothetical protein
MKSQFPFENEVLLLLPIKSFGFTERRSEGFRTYNKENQFILQNLGCIIIKITFYFTIAIAIGTFAKSRKFGTQACVI